ncbi:MAG: hypothetical protein EXR86_14140 [Gammaproteobacteria bacterium]|nr:hypothetical protein [Gammaproteobacteria bacterium]
MQSNVYAQWENFTKSAVSNDKQLEALNLELAEQLLQKQLNLVTHAVDAGNRVVALLGEGKALPEILAEQTKLASAFSSKVFETAREATEIATASQTEYRTWFEQGFKTFAEQARAAVASVVPQTSKAA